MPRGVSPNPPSGFINPQAPMSEKSIVGVFAFMGLVYIGLQFTILGEPKFRWADSWQENWDIYPPARRVWNIPEDKLDELNDAIGDLDPQSRYGRIHKLEVPRSTQSFQHELKLAIDGLPQEVKEILREHLVGVHVVGNLSMPGMPYISGLAIPQSGTFRGNDGTTSVLVDRLYSDTGMLERGITMGLRLKSASQRYVVIPKIAKKGEKERFVMLQYLLLHEFGHVVDNSQSYVSDADVLPIDDSEACGFACYSWKTQTTPRGDGRISDVVLALRNGEFRKMLEAAPDLMNTIKQSNFESLYSTSGPGEDFAESFATYVHTIIMGRPWRLSLYVDGKKTDEMISCHLDGRCPQKTAFFDTMFNRRSGPGIAKRP